MTQLDSRPCHGPGRDPEVHDDPYIADFEVKGAIGADDARHALRLAALMDSPSPARAYVEEVARLKLLTIPRNLTAEDLKLQVALLVEEFSAYPVDAARDACRGWLQTGKFFPSWAELRERCEEAVLFRRALARELRRILDRLDQEAEAAPSAPQACAVWQDKLPALKAELGEAAWKVWLSQATPYSDDSKTLVLAVATKLIGLSIRKKFGPVLERILGREVKFVIRPWAGAAAREREEREEAA